MPSRSIACDHLGRTVPPPPGRSRLKTWHECDSGHGIVSRCDCRRCPDYTTGDDAHRSPTLVHQGLTSNTPVELVEHLFRRPPGLWPDGWDGWPNVREAFRRLFADAAREPPPPPPAWEAERGVVICGGGWRFFPSVYVTIRVLRDVGCQLPVQVWYLGDRGEFDSRMAAALARFDVGWVDANAFWRDHPGAAIRRPQVDHGWLLKPFAACYAPYREVVCLDADCYPVTDPNRLLDHPTYRKAGACFWPDFAPLEPGQFERLGVPVPARRRAFETGQYLVDKGRHWHPLWLTLWLNAHYEYVWGPGYRHLYGDKDTFYLAWTKMARLFVMPTTRPGWSYPAFVHTGFDGTAAFVHRTRDKFRFHGPVDGRPVGNRYGTAQATGGRQAYNPALPHEDLCHTLVRECDELIRPEAHYDFGGSPAVRAVWQQVRLEDEYALPADLAGKRVLDIGANVGGFVAACLDRKAERVVCVEPHGPSADRMERNLARWAGRWEVDRRAVWAPGVDRLTVGPSVGDDPANTTLYSARPCPPELGKTAGMPAVTLDDLIAKHQPDLVKIDAEGAEWPALSGSRLLGQVRLVVGEYHVADWDGRRWEAADLAGLLRAHGFRVQVTERDASHGLFRAVKDEGSGSQV